MESKKSQIKFDNDFGSDSEILVQSYRELRKNKNIPGQAHHLNQNATFGDIIPREVLAQAFRESLQGGGQLADNLRQLFPPEEGGS
ncbi:hypothetical protein [Streptococcus suis]|uniref:hypothetical protein n=1 Tax=Streptococcus suis TaxID=1307 RepID=UPI00192D1E33|nr:hypothetical protein [Streptococcus suis]MBO4107928.1 hypothetical protein [Streptococcus suis]